MSKSVLLSSVLLSGSLCFVGVQLGKDHSPVVESNLVSHVENVNVSGPTDPYIVEYDFVSIENQSNTVAAIRIWSDGIIEAKHWSWDGVCNQPPALSSCTDWIVLPDSSEGYACRSDIDGDRKVDFGDLLMVINDWSQLPSAIHIRKLNVASRRSSHRPEF